MNSEYIWITSKHINSFGTNSQFWADYYFKRYREGTKMFYRLKVKLTYNHTQGGSGTYSDPVIAIFKMNYDADPSYESTKPLKPANNGTMYSGYYWEAESDWFSLEKTTGSINCFIAVNNSNTWAFDDPNYYFYLDVTPALSTITLNDGVYFDVDIQENVANTIPAVLTKYDNSYSTKLKISLKNNNNETTLIRDYQDFNSDEFSFTTEELTKIYNASSKWKMFILILELETFTSDGVSLGVYTDNQPAKISDTGLKPTFNDFTYSDNNSATYELTGDRTILVKGYSNPRLSVAGVNQATAHKGANITKYTFANGEQNKDYVLGDYPAYADLIGVKNNTLTVWVTDSREQSTKVEKLLSNLSVAEGVLKWDGDTTDREVIENVLNNDAFDFYKVSDRILTLDELSNKKIILASGSMEQPMTIDYVDYGEATDNSWFMAMTQQFPMIVVVKEPGELSQSTGTYFLNMQGSGYVKELQISEDSGTTGNWVNYEDIQKVSFSVERDNGGTSSICTLKFEGKMWDGSFGKEQNEVTNAIYKYKKTDSDEWINGDTDLIVTKDGTTYKIEQQIRGDLGAEGFDQEESYDIYIEISDQLSTVSDTITLGSGSPAQAIYKNNISLGKPYDEYAGGKVQGIYEVGDLFLTLNKQCDPARRFGGTWELIAKGKTLVGVDEEDADFNEAGKTGGEKEISLSQKQLPQNFISTTKDVSAGASDGYIMQGSYNVTGSYNFGGEGQPINNMAPYLTCYIWQRTA